MAISISSISFDETAYAPGATITMTVDYTTTDAAAVTPAQFVATVTVGDSDGSVDGTGDFNVNSSGSTYLPTTVSATDNQVPPGTWTVVSNTVSGDASPWSGVAVLTGVAA